MARLISHSIVKIDDKGRLVLPAIHRARYEEGAILSVRTEHLAIYEPAQWDVFVDRLRLKREIGEISRDEFNWVLMNSADPKVDSAGRILLPLYMRVGIKLEREALVGGNDDYLGIYKPDYAETLAPQIAATATATLNRLGL